MNLEVAVRRIDDQAARAGGLEQAQIEEIAPRIRIDDERVRPFGIPLDGGRAAG